jgi:hypothetical protein
LYEQVLHPHTGVPPFAAPLFTTLARPGHAIFNYYQRNKQAIFQATEIVAFSEILFFFMLPNGPALAV